ncbi:MAG: hydroxymyristoyl-ACP dehydratase [Gammaproteobacteria bacterium]|nr:hydroxymyristoyl-ACP dehydratase [Gammaproteobacteria bacterium]
MTMEIRQDASVPFDHPCLAGHFPGNPVVPGTVILENLSKAILNQWPGALVCEVINAKFLSPLKPGETVSMHLSRQAKAVHFDCKRAGDLIATGRLAVTFR